MKQKYVVFFSSSKIYICDIIFYVHLYVPFIYTLSQRKKKMNIRTVHLLRRPLPLFVISLVRLSLTLMWFSCQRPLTVWKPVLPWRPLVGRPLSFSKPGEASGDCESQSDLCQESYRCADGTGLAKGPRLSAGTDSHGRSPTGNVSHGC